MGPCDNLEGWNGVGGGRGVQEGTYVYLWLIHVDVWQKPTQYCRAIILQLKIKLKKILSSREKINEGCEQEREPDDQLGNRIENGRGRSRIINTSYLQPAQLGSCHLF